MNTETEIKSNETTQAKLDAVLQRMTEEQSDYALVMSLPVAKALYQALHPETRQGGARQTGEQNDTLSFCGTVAEATGHSTRTIERRVEVADILLGKRETFRGLIPDVHGKILGTPLANQLGVLVRLARLPEADQTRIADLFIAGPKKAKKAKSELTIAERYLKLVPVREASDNDEPPPKRDALLDRLARIVGKLSPETRAEIDRLLTEAETNAKLDPVVESAQLPAGVDESNALGAPEDVPPASETETKGDEPADDDAEAEQTAPEGEQTPPPVDPDADDRVVLQFLRKDGKSRALPFISTRTIGKGVDASDRAHAALRRWKAKGWVDMTATASSLNEARLAEIDAYLAQEPETKAA